MRRNNIKILICGLLLIASSCSKVLDKPPIGRLDAGSFFKTADDAIQGINAAYQPLLFNSANNNFYWAFGIMPTSMAVVGGDGSRPGLVEMDFLNYTPRTQEFNDFWKLNYIGITQSNLVLDRIESIDMDAALKNRVKGEALFLRSYYHFLLTQVFGDVPLLTEIKDPEDLRIPRDDKKLIWQQIVKDCDQAAQWLPESYPASATGRVTKGAALGLAAKANLYLEDWNGVLSHIQQLDALGIYALMPDYEDNFRKLTQNNSESVWEIQHDNLELGVGNSLNQWWCSKKISDGYGFCEVTQEYVDEFEPGDPRLKFTVAMTRDDYFGVTYFPSFSSTGYSPRKYLQSAQEVTQKADGDINYTAIRYADVLLWKAEAHAQLNQLPEALAALEQVRARARAQAANPETALPPVTAGTQSEVMQAIRHERLVELGFEMHHFFDLVRWGLASQEIPEFIQGKHEYFPIPQTELDLNPMLTQNPGY